ncbi:thioredoxin reductase [Catellatospora aurea]|uniref:Thioredoxin reductase n=1 Tax=Catellatospora aurea TaxID=1337874 RepID=A0ABW2H289_9ACTN
MTDLRYRMIMALSAIDLGNPLAEQVASVCAEISEQYCAELHLASEVAQLAVDTDPLAGSCRIAAAGAETAGSVR